MSPVAASGDTRWTVFIAQSLLTEHNTNLDEYLGLVQASRYYGVECVRDGREFILGDAKVCESGGDIYSFYPIGGPLLAMPFVFLMQHGLELGQPLLRPIARRAAGYPMVESFLRADPIGGYGIYEVIIASFLIALTSVVLFWIAVQTLQPSWAAGLAGVFAFGTSAWSVGSRAMFQHTPSMLVISLTMLLLSNARWVSWAGLTTGFAYVVRPTNGLLLVLVTVYVAIEHRAVLFRYLAFAATELGAFAAYNLGTLGHLRSAYYTLTPPFPDSRLFIALAGNLVSPGRGLFVYTPILLFSIWGMLRAWKSGDSKPMTLLRCALIGGHWLAILVSDVLVGRSLIWSAPLSGHGPFIRALPHTIVRTMANRTKGTGIRGLYGGVSGVAIHAKGAFVRRAYLWNTTPQNVDDHPERVWDWSDPAFLR